MGFWSNFWGFVKKKIDQYDEEKAEDALSKALREEAERLNNAD